MEVSDKNKLYGLWALICLLLSMCCYDFETTLYLFNAFGSGEGVIIKCVAIFPIWVQIVIIVLWMVGMYGVWKNG